MYLARARLHLPRVSSYLSLIPSGSEILITVECLFIINIKKNSFKSLFKFYYFKCIL